MPKRKVKYTPLPDCKDCGGIHYGTPIGQCVYRPDDPLRITHAKRIAAIRTAPTGEEKDNG